eukprot:gene1897-3674_t
MSNADLIRVLRGVTIVAEKIVAKNGPDVMQKFQRAMYHASELALAFREISTDLTERKTVETVPTTHDFSNSTMNDFQYDKKAENFDISSMNQSSMKAENIPPANKHDELKYPNTQINDDLIGFSRVQFTDSSSSLLEENVTTIMRERSVPSTQISRMWGFGSVAVRMAAGAAADNVSRLVTGADGSSSRLSEENAERLAEALCRMRGAALKLGQMLSIQEDAVLPPALRKALDRVRQNADYMPKRQLEHQLSSQLGSQWRSNFSEFNDLPIAAASIGQVHKAKLLDGTDVVLKIQYPGVADSIESDLNNLKRLVTMTNLLPPGLFIDSIIKVAREELAEECNYTMEAESQIKYRDLVLNDDILKKYTNVPLVYPHLSTNRVLTSTFVQGIPIDRTIQLSQPLRNAIARTILYKTIRFMQTDPNYANFLYDHDSRIINLIDFGAARTYPKTFVDGYMKLVWSAANSDKQSIIDVSKVLGFLTGDESPEMMAAHAEAGMVVGEPFLLDAPFNFAESNMSQRIGSYGGIFMKYRLTPPPSEAYSLHRKLAGAFLLCIKLKAIIPCRDLLIDAYKSYPFDTITTPPP